MSANILKFSSAEFNALLVKWQLNENMFLSEWKKVGKNALFSGWTFIVMKSFDAAIIGIQ
jgi:hypothetical protein